MNLLQKEAPTISFRVLDKVGYLFCTKVQRFRTPRGETATFRKKTWSGRQPWNSTSDVFTRAQYRSALEQSLCVGMFRLIQNKIGFTRLDDLSGQVVETGETNLILNQPKHPYTKALLQCTPVLGSGENIAGGIPGLPPRPGLLPEGCSFSPRCPESLDLCTKQVPNLVQYPERNCRCFLLE